MRILGISAFYHDSAAALIENDRIVAAVQEERFTRKKFDANYPRYAIEYCLKEAGVRLRDIDYVAFYDKPFLKFERLVETYLAFSPRGFSSFRMALPLWLREKLFLKSTLADELKDIEPEFDWDRRLALVTCVKSRPKYSNLLRPACVPAALPESTKCGASNPTSTASLLDKLRLARFVANSRPDTSVRCNPCKSRRVKDAIWLAVIGARTNGTPV